MAISSMRTKKIISRISAGNYDAPSTIEVLIVAGGGSGGRNDANGAGGGGAGGYLEGSLSVARSTNYTVTVGQGGASRTSSPTTGANGNNSVFGTATAIGGGGGGVGEGGAGNAGGSGGGAGPNSTLNGASTQTNQGTLTKYANAGGTSTGLGGLGGGGGGAGSAPGNFATGGIGRANAITGSSVTYAAGGSYGGTTTTPGANNTGNGGSGNFTANSGAGGSGVVIIKYSDTFNDPTISSGLTYTKTTPAGFKVFLFTAGTGTVNW